MKVWERRADESEKAYAAFKVYLESDDRVLTNVATKLTCNRSNIGRWASKYDWKNRALAYDNSLFEDARKEIQRKTVNFYLRQYRLNEKLLNKIEKALEERELDKISYKSLNDMKAQAFTEMLQILDKLKINDAPQDNKLEIKIISADEQA